MSLMHVLLTNIAFCKNHPKQSLMLSLKRESIVLLRMVYFAAMGKLRSFHKENFVALMLL